MAKKVLSEEQRKKMAENLAKGRATKQANREAAKLAGVEYTPLKPKRPKHLDRIVRDILNDDSLIDKVVRNQPEYWGQLPVKNGGYIIATVMMVKAMGGDIKAAEWIRRTGYGDKVMLETDNGFFSKTEFTIKVIPSNNDEGMSMNEIVSGEIKQIEG